MHSSIFQISTKPISKENYITEETFIGGDFSFYDYCANMGEEERKEAISNLVTCLLPKEMFEQTSEDTIFYKGGVEQWKAEFVANVRKKAEAITIENMLEWGPVYAIEKALTNPLDTDYHFYLNDDCTNTYAETSLSFVKFVCGLEPGTTFYVGGVVDYHY